MAGPGVRDRYGPRRDSARRAWRARQRHASAEDELALCEPPPCVTAALVARVSYLDVLDHALNYGLAMRPSAGGMEVIATGLAAESGSGG